MQIYEKFMALSKKYGVAFNTLVIVYCLFSAWNHVANQRPELATMVGTLAIYCAWRIFKIKQERKAAQKK